MQMQERQEIHCHTEGYQAGWHELQTPVWGCEEVGSYWTDVDEYSQCYFWLAHETQEDLIKAIQESGRSHMSLSGCNHNTRKHLQLAWQVCKMDSDSFSESDNRMVNEKCDGLQRFVLRDTDYEQDILKPKSSRSFACCDLLDPSSLNAPGPFETAIEPDWK